MRFFTEMHKKTFVDQASPRSAGELTAFCRNLSEFKGAVGKDREVRVVKGQRGEVWEEQRRDHPHTTNQFLDLPLQTMLHCRIQ